MTPPPVAALLLLAAWVVLLLAVTAVAGAHQWHDTDPVDAIERRILEDHEGHSAEPNAR